MATASVQLTSEPVPTGCCHRRVEELTDVVSCYSPRLHRIALTHLGNVADAEDAVQDALLAALTHIEQFKGQAKMSTWVTAIVINCSRMKLRERSVFVDLALDESRGQLDFQLADLVPDTRPGPEAQYRNREIAEVLADATSRLSPILRKTFELRDVYGLSIREAAQLLGVPAGTVKARLARARLALRKMMPKVSRSKAGRRCHR